MEVILCLCINGCACAGAGGYAFIVGFNQLTSRNQLLSVACLVGPLGFQIFALVALRSSVTVECLAGILCLPNQDLTNPLDYRINNSC